MHEKIVLALLVLQCTLCLSIRVPVDWNDESEVKYEQSVVNEEKEQTPQPPIYNEYFKYTANKPQFAIDSATTYGFQSPESHYKSHPVRPHTGLTKPVLGQHQILNSEKDTYLPFQKFVQNSVESSYVTPVSTSFEVYHPYKAEQPALQEMYKDPVLDKIRNDLRNSKNRLQRYENEAGEADISVDEYLESPAKTDRKKFPHKNTPVPYEIHRPQRRPIYYRPPVRSNYREQVLNHKLRHPWNQNIAKVTPYHYRPIKNHIHSLRQHHALKYDDEQNEYPQLPIPEKYSEVPDGYDIYEKGKAKYVKLRNNVDESINKAVQENRPYDKYKLELQNGYNNDHQNYGQDEEEFVPIKNYAQVRKTETTKHLPRTAALHDAESFEELQNAPRLREAIKSTKAQIVYSEEGYEDAAYDHAGEHKHASDHEGHGGYLKENEISGGKYQTPSVSTSYDDAKGSKYRDQLLDGKKWKDSKKENEDEVESDDYSEDNGEHDLNNDEKDNSEDGYEEKEDISQHEVIKRETSFKVPEFDFNSTLPSNAEILKLSVAKVDPQKLIQDNSNEKIKYPYYYQNIKTLNKNSPLRYAENIDLIPKKSSGGTEFYDSRSNLECPEVEENVDAVPDKLKKGNHPDETDENSDKNKDAKKADEKKFDTLKNNQRLKGLGDKIDCFKAKYFGENPLDSPFFKEDIIESPEPITKPNLKVFKPKKIEENTKDKLHYYDADIFSVLDKIHNINNNLRTPMKNESLVTDSIPSNNTDLNTQSKHVTKPSLTVRKKRAAPFTYEPYKIIRDSQIQDSKKTTTTGNISPLIKQLQSSKIIDKVTSNLDKDQNIKNNAKPYKDIGKLDRKKANEQINDSVDATFVDVNSDKRRSEPRFELRPSNHKDTYTPVENKRAISVEEYKIQTSNKTDTDNSTKQIQVTTANPKRTRSTRTTSRPFFDVSKYLPQIIESQSIAASNAVEKVIRTPQDSNEKKLRRKVEEKIDDDDDDVEEYDEYEDDDENHEEEVDITTTTTTTSTTTRRPSTRKKTRGTTTIKTTTVENETEPPKLRLITRFRNPSTTSKTKTRHEVIKDSVPKVYIETDSPKYTEKKRKSTKSMLVTDTKTYGDDDDDDITRKEVDALLHVKQDMKEYMPLYEKENKYSSDATNKKKDDDKSVDSDSDDVDKAEIEDDEDDDDGDDEDDDDDDDDEDDDSDDKEDDDENENSNDSNHKNEKQHSEITTSEPTKRTLARTTVAPATTTESRSARVELKPVILKKKFEVHEETPVNQPSPHVTHFKQDIKEIEIIKKMAPKAREKINKNSQALHLYRDENLAEEINKLGDVEVFKENLNLKEGPKHGGNYRSVTPENLQKEMPTSKQREVTINGDVEPSPTQPRKRIKLDSQVTSKHQNPSSISRSNNNAKSAKLIELSEPEEIAPKMHGGNLKYARNKGARQNDKNEKFIELDESEEDETSKMHGGNFKSLTEDENTGRQMHGGNYRSAKIVTPEEATSKPRRRTKNRDARTNAAVLLNSYARVVPILTTTPAYILDPSKRMYYYVDA
ncbi:intracellular protein transport protein USO1-like [Melitaea cinxia]|uniref:intracellular protein transport protein USO1-like n=1 Tax=Melitaea cinxia TaxID=113334 RepID=UPI001E274808|nr:intracellular protein transport protein USO1-like [Melitaea cinxia]